MASGTQAALYAQPQPHPHQSGVMVSPNQMPPQQQQQQQPFKGTLAPGTRVQVGAITVTVKRYLSEGGFAHVYLVTTNQPIPMPSSSGTTSSNTPSSRGEYTHVLKRMAVPDKEALSEVRGEVEVHKLLRNQVHIVHFIEASATSLPRGGYEIFILMEFCAGGGIIDLMNARLRDRLREDEVLKIFADVCDGLSVMHHLDPPMMHRDLKVENILLAPPSTRGGPPTYKLCDFGSASPVLSRRAPKSVDEIRRVEADLNKHTTLQYRAPEMVDPYQRRVIDEKADIWALGVLLYKLCYYTTPFEENGGGPLAILNARYRFPPHPPYSQKIKDLIASLLQEQSSARPSIDEVLIRTHSLLGTKPPASALHYAQQAAEGKISTPLPSVSSYSTSSSSGVDLESRRIAAAQSQSQPQPQHQSSDAADLIRIGPSEAERAKAESEAIRKQNESITPMRRGRPGKNPANSANSSTKLVGSGTLATGSSRPGGAVSGSHQLTGEKATSAEPTDRGDAWKSSQPNRSLSFSKAAGALDSAAASAALGFGDSFQPSLSSSVTAASLPTPGSAHESPIQHSPALPGLNPSPSPRPSPISSPPPVSASPPRLSPLPPPTSRPTMGSKQTSTEDPEASSRFPSVEELDAKYASPLATSKAPVSIPSSESRESMSSIAGRFERPKSSSNSVESNPVARRWPPVSGSSDNSLSVSPGGSKASGLSARSLRARGSESNRHSMFPSSSSSSVASSNGGLKPAKSSGALRDSMTGDSLRNAPALPERRKVPAEDWITEEAKSNRSGLSPEMDLLGRAYKSPSRYGSNSTSSNSTSPGLRSAVEKPTRMDSTASSDSSGDEGPEELDSRKKFSQFASNTAPVSQPSTKSTSQSAGPGKVKTPTWVLEQGNENAAPPPLPSKDSVNALRAAKLGAAEDMREASRGLERDADGETIAPLASDTDSSIGQMEEDRQDPEDHAPESLLASASRAKARAPAWDEDDEEQVAMRSGLGSKAVDYSTNGQVGTLVDLSNESKRAFNPSVAPIKQILDEEDPPMAEPQQYQVSEKSDEGEDIQDSESAKAVPSTKSPPLVAPKAKSLSSSGSTVGGILSRYESISSGLSEAPPARPTEKKPISSRYQPTVVEKRDAKVGVDSSSRDSKEIASDRRSPRQDRGESTSPVHSKGETARSPIELVRGSGSGFSNVRQRSLLNDSNPSGPLDGKATSVSSSSSGSQSVNQNDGSISRGKGLALRSETAPVVTQPLAIAPKKGLSTIGLKPWEREAAELEEINRQGGVRTVIKSEDEALPFTASPKFKEPQVISPTPERSRPAQSVDGGNERSSSVGNLISQWQKNAESNARGWGKIGDTRGGVGDRPVRQRLPGTDV